MGRGGLVGGEAFFWRPVTALEWAWRVFWICLSLSDLVVGCMGGSVAAWVELVVFDDGYNK